MAPGRLALSPRTVSPVRRNHVTTRYVSGWFRDSQEVGRMDGKAKLAKRAAVDATVGLGGAVLAADGKAHAEKTSDEYATKDT